MEPLLCPFSQFVFLQSLILALEIKISSLLSLSFFDRLSSCYYYPPPRTCMTPFLDPNHWLSVINSLDLKNLATKLVIRNCLIINFLHLLILEQNCNNTYKVTNLLSSTYSSWTTLGCENSLFYAMTNIQLQPANVKKSDWIVRNSCEVLLFEL